MTIIEMKRTETALGQQGAWYQEKIELTDTNDSDAILLPIFEIYSIAVQSTGDVIIFATSYTKADIENDTAVWEEWNGTSNFSLSTTAIKAENQSGSSTTVITVKVTEV